MEDANNKLIKGFHMSICISKNRFVKILWFLIIHNSEIIDKLIKESINKKKKCEKNWKISYNISYKISLENAPKSLSYL